MNKHGRSRLERVWLGWRMDTLKKEETERKTLSVSANTCDINKALMSSVSLIYGETDINQRDQTRPSAHLIALALLRPKLKWCGQSQAAMQTDTRGIL